jgi:hypothetical protein
MKKMLLILGCFLAFGCAGESAGEPVEISAEELKAGVYHGGGGLVLGNTPYGDCLTDCSHEKDACERANTDRVYDDLMRPCDLEYSFCRADCKRAFPE